MLQVARSAFVKGYEIVLRHAADGAVRSIPPRLAALGPARLPFAFEGAGKALRMGQERPPFRPSVAELMEITDERWHLFLRLGVGCAEARLGSPAPEHPEVQDGYGFQLGLLYGASGQLRTDLDAVAHGLGRAAWFVSGGHGETCASLLCGRALMAAHWRGIGMACVFAGDPMSQASSLPEIAGRYADDVRQGGRRALELWRWLAPEVVPARVLATARDLEVAGGEPLADHAREHELRYQRSIPGGP